MINMKYGLYVAKTLMNGTSNGNKNIGDYIQNLAAMQFLPSVDDYYDREAYDNGTNEIKMIMNAWYMWNAEYFPVSDRVVPLYISMHISPYIKDKFLTPKTIEYLKKYEPIGCRDKYTESLLKSFGVDAYFSGCLTLTLGNKYKIESVQKNESICFVDPYLALIGKKEVCKFELLKCMFYSLYHIYTWLSINKKFVHSCIGQTNKKIKKLFYSAIFLTTYKKIFTLKELRNAIFKSHSVLIGEGTELITEEDKLLYCENLLKEYMSSKMVVTSRLHCALPCLSMQEPVLFTVGIAKLEKSSLSSANRFDGLIELLNVAKIKGTKITELPTKEKITSLKNKDDYKSLAQALTQKCKEFIND